MIQILCDPEQTPTAKTIADHLQRAYENQLEIDTLPLSHFDTSIRDSCWDDIVMVLFQQGTVLKAAEPPLAQPQKERIIPVALDSRQRMPPDPISGIKAVDYDDGSLQAAERIVRSVGTKLGLRLRRSKTKIFISYRASDGSAIAHQLEHFLDQQGYNPWRDEACADEDEGNIAVGEAVQKAIEKNLSNANLMLLIDTPSVTQSDWVSEEIDLANGALIPILPICCRDQKDRDRGSRFRSLDALRRWVPVGLDTTGSKSPLREMELEAIQDEMEHYLCEIYRRKLRLPFIARNRFDKHGYSWSDLDKHHLFRSTKAHHRRISWRVLSHCSILNEVNPTELRSLFGDEHDATTENFRLFIYDGDVIPDREIEALAEMNTSGNLLIVHYQELDTLLRSHFTRLTS